MVRAENSSRAAAEQGRSSMSLLAPQLLAVAAFSMSGVYCVSLVLVFCCQSISTWKKVVISPLPGFYVKVTKPPPTRDSLIGNHISQRAYLSKRSNTFRVWTASNRGALVTIIIASPAPVQRSRKSSSPGNGVISVDFSLYTTSLDFHKAV